MEGKYVHIFPERAVAPLRDFIEGLIVDIVGSQYGQTITVELKDLRAALNAFEDNSFPAAEPLFLLRGQDILAPDVVRAYADQVVLMEGAFGDVDNAAAVIERIRAFADRMEAWEPRKLPD